MQPILSLQRFMLEDKLKPTKTNNTMFSQTCTDQSGQSMNPTTE